MVDVEMQMPNFEAWRITLSSITCNAGSIMCCRTRCKATDEHGTSFAPVIESPPVNRVQVATLRDKPS